MADQQGETGPDSPSRSGPGEWARLHLWQIQPLRDVGVVLVLLGLLWLGSVISVVSVPLLLAILLAYLVEPVVKLMVRKTFLERRGAVLVMMVGIGGAVVIPVGLGLAYGATEAVHLSREIGDDVRALRASLAEPDNERLERLVPDGVWSGVREGVLWMRTRAEEQAAAERDARAEAANQADHGENTEATPDGATSSEDSLAPPPGDADEPASTLPNDPVEPAPDVAQDDVAAPAASVESRESAADAALKWIEDNAGAIARNVFRTGGNALSALIGLVGALTSLAIMVFLTVFFFFFVSTGWAKVLDFLRGLVPEAHRDRSIELSSKLDRVVSGFVRGRLIIALILGAWFSVGWWAVGVPLAPLVGMATGLLAAFPYAALAGLPVAIILLALENHLGFRGTWWWTLAGPLLIYQAGQLADDYLLTPAIQGKETDLDVPSIMFAVFAGGALFGVYGLLIAIPFAACLKVVLREVLWPRYRAWVSGERPDALPLDPGSTNSEG